MQKIIISFLASLALMLSTFTFTGEMPRKTQEPMTHKKGQPQ